MIAKLVGFSVQGGATTATTAAEHRIEEQFPWLEHRTIAIEGGPHVLLWGHGAFDSHVHHASDGALWLLATANTPPSWAAIVVAYGRDPASASAQLEGAFLLARVHREGVQLWNDWTGMTKAYVWNRAGRWGVATLEPISVDAAGVGEDDISQTSVYSLMRFGCYFGTATLYRSIQLLAPDSFGTVTATGFRSCPLRRVQPTEIRWSAGWDDVIDEWAELLERVFADALAPSPSSPLMLSGGIDSRVIAAVRVAVGHRFRAISYGNRIWKDGVFAKLIAEALELPLDYHEIGSDYLRRFTKPWCDWFGASMCVHGMYQFPGMLALREAGQREPITTGFTGDPLEGQQIASLMRKAPDSPSRLAQLSKNFTILDDEAITKLVPRLDVGAARAELEHLVDAQYASFDGAEFQRMWLLFQWNRVFQFSSHQPVMYEYYFGVITPFVDSRLVNFTLSLPRMALEGRRVFFELLKRRYPAIAKVPGTYSQPSQVFDFLPERYGIPLLLTKRYLAKAAVGYALPEALRRGPLREFGPAPNVFALEALRRDGVAALYPLDTKAAAGWFDHDVVNAQIKQLLASDDGYASAKLWPIQTLVHRLSPTNGNQ